MFLTMITRALALLALLVSPSTGFVSSSTTRRQTCQLMANGNVDQVSRRNVVSALAFGIAGLVAAPVLAAEEAKTLESHLYTILRVREATLQEARLINSGKFKDVQRANVKLAVRFMLKNYRLGDAFIAASAYLGENSRRISASEVGSSAVQNLQTILEYFDSSDVANLKVSRVELIERVLSSRKKSH
jgi:hypothetical protein